MSGQFKTLVDRLRLAMTSSPVWADVMILADRVEQKDPAEIPGPLRTLVDTELRRRRAVHD